MSRNTAMFANKATTPTDPGLNEKLLDEALGDLDQPKAVPGVSNPPWLNSLTGLLPPALQNGNHQRKDWGPDHSKMKAIVAAALANSDIKKEQALLAAQFSAVAPKEQACPSAQPWSVAPQEKAARTWSLRDLLPMPLPVFLALICGAVGAAVLGLCVFLALVAASCVLVPLAYRCCMLRMAAAMKSYAEQEDRHMFGVDVHIRSMDLSVCYGQLVIHDMVVENPQGFKSEYLLKAKKIFVDLDMAELIKTRGQHVSVQDMKFDGVDAIVEYDSVLFGSAFGTSNLQKVLDYMHNRPAKDPKKTTAPRKWTFEKVAFMNVGAQFATKAGEARFECADLRYRHFSQEMDSQHLAELVPQLVIALNKTILTNIAGRSFVEKHL